MITSTAVTAALFSNPLSLAAAELSAPGQRRLDLNGHWQLARSGADDWIPATMPGCVHTDLLAAGKTPDPFFRDNEKSLLWIGETNWTFRRTFDVSTEILRMDWAARACGPGVAK